MRQSPAEAGSQLTSHHHQVLTCAMMAPLQRAAEKKAPERGSAACGRSLDKQHITHPYCCFRCQGNTTRYKKLSPLDTERDETRWGIISARSPGASGLSVTHSPGAGFFRPQLPAAAPCRERGSPRGPALGWAAGCPRPAGCGTASTTRAQLGPRDSPGGFPALPVQGWQGNPPGSLGHISHCAANIGEKLV